MKLFPIIIFFSLFLLSSCEGLLWDGADNSSGDELTISIQNPYHSSARAYNSRALALQGEYLYIELARIDDYAAYNTETEEGTLPLTGNGVWKEKSWGGHAILTFNLSNISAFIATFKGVPRGEDIMARVIQDLESTYLNDGLFSGSYSEVGPLSVSNNSDAPDLFYPVDGYPDIYDTMWIDILSSDLQNNKITIPIRVTGSYINYSIPQFTALDDEYSEQYVDSLVAISGSTEPDPSNPDYDYPTKFSLIDIDFTNEYLRDAGIFLLVDPTTNLIGHVTTVLYESDGSPAEYSGNSERYLYVALPEIDESYLSSDLFIGSTNISPIELTDTNYSGGQYDVSYGVLYDSLASAGISSGEFSNELYVGWATPSGFISTDLEFNIIHLYGSAGLTLTDLETVDKIYSNPIELEVGWNSYSTLEYIDLDYPSVDGDWIVILARKPGSNKVFIYARMVIEDWYT